MIRYIPFIAAAGGGAVPLHWFENEDQAPGGVVTSGPAAEQAAFLSELTVSGVEDFEALRNNTSMAGRTSTINGVVMTYSAGFNTAFPIDGRFNTTSGGSKCVECGGVLTMMSLTFSTPIAALGMYLTDVGDFAGQVSWKLYISGGGTITHDLDHTIAGPSGSLMFVGFVDGIDEYTQVDIISSTTAEGIGIDDIYVATQAQLA